MTLFEQFGKRITDAGQGVAQQAKNFSETTRLNAKIADNKKKMSQLLFELGQEYYKAHRKDVDCEGKKYIDEVNELFQEILKLQKDIEAIKSSKVCNTCGARIPEGASFCMSCGAKIDADDAFVFTSSEVRRCPACGNEVDTGNAYCIFCGNRLSADEDDEIVAEDDYVRLCPACGMEVQDEDFFCQNCGKKL